jgi:hypothetical protein
MVMANEVSIVKFKIDYGELESFPGNVYQKIREGKKGIAFTIKKLPNHQLRFLKIFKESFKILKRLFVSLFLQNIQALITAIQAIKIFTSNRPK